MKNWYIGVNDYWFNAAVYLHEVPVVLYYLEWIVEWTCSIIPSIPLPKMLFKLKDKSSWEYTDNNDGWSTLLDWFGDIHQLFHAYVCIPVHNFVWKHTKSTHIELPYHFLKEKFPAEFERDLETEWDEEDQAFRIKAEILAAWSDSRFRDVYKTLDHTYKEGVLK